MPTYTRRQVLARGGAVAATSTMLPMVGRVGTAFGLTEPDPSTAERNRLVIVFLAGGNDGLNTVIPTADVDGTQRRSVYEQVRGGLTYQPSEVLPLDRTGDADQALGLHPSLTRLHDRYRDGDVAIVQGVDYPDHSFSHFRGTEYWESGDPGGSAASGWIGRHLDRAGIGEAELRGLAVHRTVPLTLQGTTERGSNLTRVPPPWADTSVESHGARHAALRTFADYPSTDLNRHFAGTMAARTVDLVDRLESEPPPPSVDSGLADKLLSARVLLEGNYGVEVTWVNVGSFDTHGNQRGTHERLLSELDQAIEVFFHGDAAQGVAPMSAELAERTILMTSSEFGRRVASNASGGTDHGSAAPQFLVSPTGHVGPGLHGEHPSLGTTALPADNLGMTTDLRSLYQTVLEDWLGDPDPDYSVDTLTGLIV